MAKQTRITNAAAKVLCNALTAMLDAGSTLRVFDGTIPTDLETALTTQNLLVQMSIPFPAFGAAVDGGGKATASATEVIAAAATASGLASFFRAYNNAGIVVEQGTVGLIDADLVLGSTNIILGVSVRVNSWKINISEMQTVC